MFAAAGVAAMRSIGGYFHSTLLNLEKSANQGCQLCQMLLPNMEDPPPRDQWSSQTLTFYLVFMGGGRQY